MVKIIAHRGNIEGPDPATENTPEVIERAIALGFDCEIDVWYLCGQYYLGHDFPQLPISYEFLETHGKSLWIHCKHLDALLQLKDSFNCFYHDKDIYTLTSCGYIWGNINSPTHPLVVQVMPEKSGTFSPDCYAICTDFCQKYRSLLLK
jgi:hypothetical protein